MRTGWPPSRNHLKEVARFFWRPSRQRNRAVAPALIALAISTIERDRSDIATLPLSADMGMQGRITTAPSG